MIDWLATSDHHGLSSLSPPFEGGPWLRLARPPCSASRGRLTHFSSPTHSLLPAARPVDAHTHTYAHSHPHSHFLESIRKQSSPSGLYSDLHYNVGPNGILLAATSGQVSSHMRKRITLHQLTHPPFPCSRSRFTSLLFSSSSRQQLRTSSLRPSSALRCLSTGAEPSAAVSPASSPASPPPATGSSPSASTSSSSSSADPKLSSIVDQIEQLTLLQASELVAQLKVSCEFHMTTQARFLPHLAYPFSAHTSFSSL